MLDAVRKLGLKAEMLQDEDGDGEFEIVIGR